MPLVITAPPIAIKTITTQAEYEALRPLHEPAIIGDGFDDSFITTITGQIGTSRLVKGDVIVRVNTRDRTDS